MNRRDLLKVTEDLEKDQGQIKNNSYENEINLEHHF